ncbi:MAG TPA: four helix bundle protein [bacterium]|nr:four helix bundle protein [bacterium]
MNSYKDLKVWQKSIDLVCNVYNLCAKLPSDEKYGISSQMKRSSVSIPSNIAEGFMRYHKAEYIQFLHISRSSSAELDTQLTICQRVFPDREPKLVTQLLIDNAEIMMMLNGLIKSLKK